MVVTFLDKLSSFLDRRILVAYWMPVFFVSGLAIGSSIGILGWGTVWGWWMARNVSEQALLGVAGLLLITLSAYVLQAFTVPLIQLFEGYWPRWVGGLTEWARQDQAARQRAFEVAGEDGDQKARYHFNHDYPGLAENLRATLLGNVLTAAEEYAYQVYRLDSVPWWPRLPPLLPDALRSELDSAVTPLIALVNLSALLAILTLLNSTIVVATDAPWWSLGVVVLIGCGLSRLCYEAAVGQARKYGDLVRTAFDLYRQMNVTA